MFRQVRKKVNALDSAAAESLLATSRRGVLALNGEDGYPYAIPINYFYHKESGKIYFHGAKAGYKVDCLKASDKVCFTVYGNITRQEGEEWAPYVQSTVVFGRCRLLGEGDPVMEHLKTFAMKYYPSESLVDEEIAHAGKAVQMFEITIEHMTAKQVQER